MGVYKVAQLGGSSKVVSWVPWGQGQEVQAYPPVGSHTLRCQWSQWRRWPWCPHAHSEPGVAELLAPQCSSPGPGRGHSAAWHSSFPTCPFSTPAHSQSPILKCNSFFPESSERLSGTRCWKEEAVPMWGRGDGKAQVRFATLFLPLCFHEVPLASSSHSSWAVCYLPSPHTPICLACPVFAAHFLPDLLTISVCFWLM